MTVNGFDARDGMNEATARECRGRGRSSGRGNRSPRGARHGRRLVLGGVHIDAVLSALPKQVAAVGLDVADEVLSLHGAARANRSRVTFWPRVVFAASSRFASNTIAT